jgi:hypothetical protein
VSDQEREIAERHYFRPVAASVGTKGGAALLSCMCCGDCISPVCGGGDALCESCIRRMRDGERPFSELASAEARVAELRAERDAAVKALEGLREAAEGTMSALASWSSVRPNDPDYGGIPAAALEMAHALRAALDAALSPPTPAAMVEAPDPLHPTGRCTCAGEGTCAWCLSHCVHCGAGIAAPPSAPSEADRRVGETVAEIVAWLRDLANYSENIGMIADAIERKWGSK